MGRELGKKKRLWVQQDNLNAFSFYLQYREILKEKSGSVEDINTFILEFVQDRICEGLWSNPSLKEESASKVIQERERHPVSQCSQVKNMLL